MKILITEPEYFPEKAIEQLKKLGDVVAEKLDKKHLLEKIETFDIIIVRVDTPVDKTLMDKAKKLKIIATPITGTNHIDMEYAEKKGIKVINAPGVNANAAAEFTFSLIMALSRKIPQSFASIKRNEWNRSKYIGKELSGKTIGIIGLGRIGSRIAHFANAFDMKILAHDKYVDKSIASKLNANLVSLDDLLKKSDIITVNCILTDETKDMLSRKEFELMNSPILVNTSRAEVIDESALIDALKAGKISGAALDVFSEETELLCSPTTAHGKLLEYAKSHENIIITPHIGGSTEEAVLEAALFTVNKIKELI